MKATNIIWDIDGVEIEIPTEIDITDKFDLIED